MSDFSKKKGSTTVNTFQVGNQLEFKDGQLYKIAVPTLLGVIAEPLTYLADSIKTRLQVQNKYDKMPTYNGVSEIFKQNSIKQLYRGLLSGFLSKSSYLLAKFYTYESTKFMFHAGVIKVSFWRTYSGLMFSEFVGALFQAPFEIIKSRLICQTENTIKEVIKVEKSRLMQTITMLNFNRLILLRGSELATYLTIKEKLVENANLESNSPVTFLASVFSASLVGAAVTSPFDYLKTLKSLNLYPQNLTSFKYFIKILKESKGKDFYKGFGPLFSGVFIHNLAFFGLDSLRFQQIIKF